MTEPTTVHIQSLGCARNDVDSEELAGRLAAEGFVLVDDADDADAVMVNTCGFIESAKQDSVNTLLAAADLKDSGRTKAVVAVGCMAERYGVELAEALPEADAVLGFDAYTDMADRLRRILAGDRPESHVPRDRRTLLPLSPRARSEVGAVVPGHGALSAADTDAEAPVGSLGGPGHGGRVVRHRLGQSPMAPVKLASGCDRRCAFCAIPKFRGAYLSRPPADVVAEVEWLVDHGVREVFLVSENSSSYGKDLGDIRALEALLPELSKVDGLDWIRVSYLQPAEMRPGLVDVMARTEKVVPYFDLSFQHASGPLLRRMRRFGDAESFLTLIDQVRQAAPTAGIRSNVIVGFPGETDEDVATLHGFLGAAGLDAVGVFGYSDEEGTEGATLDGHVDPEIIEERRAATADLVDTLMNQRAAERIGEDVTVLIEEIGEDGEVVGRAEHQGPEVDGQCLVRGAASIGDLITGRVVDAIGVDLVVEPDATSHAGSTGADA